VAVRSRYCYDTEFIEDGRTIELVSIGIVGGDGREYYAVSTEFDPARAIPWVRDHVLAQLPPPADRAWKPRARIRDEVLAFLTADGREPETWAWYGDYDHVVLCQLFGSMPQLPRPLPRFTRDLRQWWEQLGEPWLPEQVSGEHDALCDARHNAAVYDRLAQEQAALGWTLPR